jgi:peptidoglycan/LPS O-acetylase OafA/YrhL
LYSALSAYSIVSANDDPVSEVMTSASASHPRRNLDLAVLDALRGLAALYVMLGHASGLLWAGLSDSVSNGDRGPALALAFTAHHLLRWPHEAVLLFFLLSGFCIHYRQAKGLASAPGPDQARPRSIGALLDVRSYAQRRFRRLYPPLLLALALTLLFDYLGGQFNPGFYQGLTLSLSPTAPLPDHSLATLVGNLLLQPSFAVQPFGSNGPLWSLAFEAGFYLLYPVLLLASARMGASGMMIATALISLGALLMVPSSTPAPGESLAAYQASGMPIWIPILLMYWIVWAMGALVAEAHAGRIRVRGLNWLAALSMVGLVVLIITLGQFAARSGAWRFYDLAWGAGLAVLLAFLLLSMPPRWGIGIERGARFLAPLGNISYSLYVVHLPWLVLISAWWLSWHSTLPVGGELGLAGMLSALLLAATCWYFVERHCVTPRQQRRAPVPLPQALTTSPGSILVGERRA